MKKNTFIFIIFTLALFILPRTSLAASVFLSTPSAAHIGDTFEVIVHIDTGGIIINSVDLSLNYDRDFLSFSGYKDDQGVVKLWISSPHEEKDGLIQMSGIVPGGVSGLYDSNKIGISAVPVVALLFTAEKAGATNISFIQTKILQHDGKGTELAHDQKSLEFNILDKSAVSSVLGGPENCTATLDKNPPAIFEITFIESSLFSQTPPMIIFNTSDAESGIKEYKMQIGNGVWFDTKSPQPIRQSIFSRNITVRAFDFNGNYRDAKLHIPGIISLKYVLLIISFLILSGILGLKLLKYKV